MTAAITSSASSAYRALARGGDGTASGLARRILDPLCEETARMLRPVGIKPSDRMRISLDESGRKFVCDVYAKHVVPPDPRIVRVLEALENGDLTDEGARAALAIAAIEVPEGKSFREWVAELDAERERRAKAVGCSWQAGTKWFQNVPEAEQVRDGRWELAATDVTALVINANWLDAQVEWEPEARAIYVFLLSRFLKQTINSHIKAQFKVNGVMPELPEDWTDHPDMPLAKYQQVAAVTSLGEDAALRFMEQGTGKTPVEIRTALVEASRHFRREQERVLAEGPGARRKLYTWLIVAPKNVRYNWRKEIEKFATVPGKVTVLRGGFHKRMRTWMETIIADDEDSQFAAVIVGYEGAKLSLPFLKGLQWNRVTLDESHHIKAPRRARGRAMLELRDVAEQRTCLTGTPVTNKLFDLYMQLEFVGEGLSGFSSYDKFKSFYGSFDREGNRQRETLVSYQNLPFLKERLARLAFQVTKKEALPDLPEKRYQVREVEMTQKQRERYVRLQSQLALEIEGGGKQMTATNILVKLLRLAQITSGFFVWDAAIDPETGDVVEGRSIELLTPNPKIEELVRFVREEVGEDEKVIIWACFIPDVKVISERLRAEGFPGVTFTGATSDADRAEAERRFNGEHARDCKWFCGNPAAGGVGLNLWGYDPVAVERGEDHGCNCAHVVYYSQNWSMVHRNQSEDRAHRRGTRASVTYTDLVIPGTIDEEIRSRVLGKTMNAMNVQDVREIMKRVLESMPDEDDDEGGDDGDE